MANDKNINVRLQYLDTLSSNGIGLNHRTVREYYPI